MINKLAKLAGISVRTLHYYDQIDLLKPAFINASGYRHYKERELLLLQQILFFRELDFPLEKIKAILHHRNFDLIQAMEEQRDLLRLKQKRTRNLLQTVDKTIAKLKGDKMEDKDLFEAFDEKQIEEYKREAEERWGNTDIYKQSVEQTKGWTKADLEKVSREWAEIAKAYAKNMDKGVDSSEVQKIVQSHWDQINKFYDCSTKIFSGLAEMYVADERFARNYNKYQPHLAEFVRDAILYFCKNK